jgi:phosphoglucosamine mutase
MTIQRKYFGTDGIRGIAGTAPINPETLVRLGKAVATIFMRSDNDLHGNSSQRNKRVRILIGKDTRLSGYMVESSLAAGITAMGADILLCGPVPTPGVAYLTKSMRADAGIVISASHNPYEDNGIKIFGADGLKLADELEEQIEALLEPGALDERGADACHIGKASRIDDAIGRYTVFLKESFPRELSLNGVKIGLDCANGAGYVVAPQTLTELGADVVARGVTPTGRNINDGFGSLFPEVVGKLVVEQNLNLGIALDGDADRCILVDETGKIHDGDTVLAICALDLKARGLLRNNTVVATVMSNLGLDLLLAEHGIKVVRTSVGDRAVLEEMLRQGAQLGGELSGHTIFSDISTTGDGLLTALMVISSMGRQGKSLSELARCFTPFAQRLISIKVGSKPPIDSIEPIKRAIEEKERSLGDQGRILVRYSGTEDKLRVMVECRNQDECNKHAQELAQVVERELGVI